MFRKIQIIFAFTIILLLASCNSATQALQYASDNSVITDTGAQSSPISSKITSPSPSASPSTNAAPSASASPSTNASPSANPSTSHNTNAVPGAGPSPSPSSTPSPETIQENGKGILGSNVAFRKEANGDSNIICRLSKGSVVEILKTNVNAEWDQVKYNGKVGYVNRVYVPLDSLLDEYKIEYTGKVVNCKNNVSIRSTPSKSSKEVGTANLGDTLKVLQKDYSNGWDQVTFEGQTAYISSSYLDVNAVVPDTQLSGLSISGGSLYPAFSPKEYEYRITASSSNVTLKAKANSGVNININGEDTDSMKISMPSGSVKFVNISLNGKQRYSFVITRNILIWGTWNIKSGNGQLPMQGRLVYDQQPDIMGIQEAVQNNTLSNIVDDLASLKTNTMCYTDFSRTYFYSGDYEFGDGILSRYKLNSIQNFSLDSSGYEPRLLQKAVVNIGGKTVSVYNTHFTYQTADARAKEFAEVLSFMSKDKNKYKILTGDFNAHDSEFDLFRKNYNVCISSDAKYYNPSGGLINHNAIDNFIITKNIKVVNTNFIETSLSDHNAVFAYLVLQ